MESLSKKVGEKPTFSSVKDEIAFKIYCLRGQLLSKQECERLAEDFIALATGEKKLHTKEIFMDPNFSEEGE